MSVPSHFPVTTDAAAMTSIMHISPGAPLELTEDLLTTFNVAAVVRGTVTETGASGAELDERRYAAARKRGIFRRACRCWSWGWHGPRAQPCAAAHVPRLQAEGSS